MTIYLLLIIILSAGLLIGFILWMDNPDIFNQLKEKFEKHQPPMVVDNSEYRTQPDADSVQKQRVPQIPPNDLQPDINAAVVSVTDFDAREMKLPEIAIRIECSMRREEVAQPNEPELEGNYSYWIPLERTRRRVHARLRLCYEKTSGEITHRDFDVQSFQRGDQGYGLFGFCHLRQAPRSLVTPGILECINLDSGEVVADVCTFIDDLYVSTPGARLDTVMERHAHELDILLYMAKADGAMRAKEREIILDYIFSVMDPGGPLREAIEEDVKRWQPPTDGEFKKAVRELIKFNRIPTLIYVTELSRQIIATQKTIHPDEARALSYMEKKLKAITG